MFPVLMNKKQRILIGITFVIQNVTFSNSLHTAYPISGSAAQVSTASKGEEPWQALKQARKRGSLLP